MASFAASACAWLARRPAARHAPRALASLLLGAAVLHVPVGTAAPGDIDASFRYAQPSDPERDTANVIEMPDGGWIAVRNRATGSFPATRIELRRIDADGNLVTSFGTGGVASLTLPDDANLSVVAVRAPNGDLLLGGWTLGAGVLDVPRAALLRLDATGRAVWGSAADSLLTLPPAAARSDVVGGLRVLPDGRILVATVGNVAVHAVAGDCYEEDGRAQLLRVSADGRSVESLRADTLDWPISCARIVDLLALPDGNTLWNNSDRVSVVDSDGRTVTRFGEAGELPGPSHKSRAAVGADGSIAAIVPLYTAYWTATLARFDASGAPIDLPRDAVDPYPISFPDNAGQVGSYSFLATITAVAADAARGVWYAGYVTRDGDVGVVRFRADGSVDTGWHGKGVVGLPAANRVSVPRGALLVDVQRLTVQPDGKVVVALSDGRMFRLLGGSDVARGGIGVQQGVRVPLRNVKLNVLVSRTGGSTGAASVEYRVAELDAGSTLPRAVAGRDFGPASGRFDWSDGESGTRAITVEIGAGSGATDERYFQVELRNASGAAIFAPAAAVVAIAPSASATTPSTPAPTPTPGGGGGGGGAFDPATLAALLAALVVAVRRRTSKPRVAPPLAMLVVSLAALGIRGSPALAAPGDIDPSFAVPPPAAGAYITARYLPLPDGGWLSVGLRAPTAASFSVT